MRITYIAALLGSFATVAATAQELPMTVALQQIISTATSHNGDPVTARVTSPASLQGDTVTGRVTDVKAGNRFRGGAVLNFTFDTLQHNGQNIPITARVTSMANSKGQADVDEQGRSVQRSSGAGQTAVSKGFGTLMGGITGGKRGAAVSGVDAAGSLAQIQVSSKSPELEFGPGSTIGLTASSHGGPELASLQPSTQAAASAAGSAAPNANSQQAQGQTASASTSSTGQPDLKAAKIDFIPGEKTILYEDWSGDVQDEPPSHWKVRDGATELRTGGGIRQLTAVCPSKVTLTSEDFTTPENFTMEIEVAFGGSGGELSFNAWPADVEGDERPSWEIDVNPGQVRGQGPKEDIGSGSFEETLNRPIKVALWVQNGRARLYANGERVADVNQMFVPKDMQPPRHWVVRERCDRADDGWVGIRTVRMAESAPDFSAVMASSGKYVTHGIRFDTDSDRIQPESAAVIKSVARGLEKNPNLKLRITGYTDSTGSADHNTDLSKRRAEAVRTVLISDFGVDASRLSADGKGAANPIGSNDTPDGRAQNRRVEFVKE